MVTMNLMDFKITLKDLLFIFTYVVLGIVFVVNIQNSLERTGEKLVELQSQVIEMKNDGRSGTKENQIFLQSIQNQVNATNTQLMVLDQRVSFLEQQSRGKK